ncbi:hypothetical protein H5410_041058 [Solanum commersonii]|uniref:DUF1985 domain-containing protein n=1 Tax=Solanum commersonii TaxID=4109 RepID=A0A9J5XTR6_SOLCO|nr:hypothetical protein H5410_041058 [Solanum commersonii]
MKLRMMLGSKLSMHTLSLCICILMLLVIASSEKSNARFQMTNVYELLKRRFIFQNPEKKDEVLINYCGMPLFFGRREFAIVSGLKCHLPSKPIPEFIDIEAFNNYPWGHESFELTIKYLLKPLGPKTNNLFGFPWAFMAWAFEAIPHLRHQVNTEEEISFPRILRWLREKTKTVKNPPDLYNPPHDAVVHPWLVATENELKMPYLITLGLVETLFDPVVDRVKTKLAGARTIKRDRVDNELVVFDGVDGGGIDAGAGVDGGGDIGAGAGQDQRATSCKRCSGFLYEKCKKQD